MFMTVFNGIRRTLKQPKQAVRIAASAVVILLTVTALSGCYVSVEEKSNESVYRTDVSAPYSQPAEADLTVKASLPMMAVEEAVKKAVFKIDIGKGRAEYSYNTDKLDRFIRNMADQKADSVHVISYDRNKIVKDWKMLIYDGKSYKEYSYRAVDNRTFECDKNVKGIENADLKARNYLFERTLTADGINYRKYEKNGETPMDFFYAVNPFEPKTPHECAAAYYQTELEGDWTMRYYLLSEYQKTNRSGGGESGSFDWFSISEKPRFTGYSIEEEKSVEGSTWFRVKIINTENKPETITVLGCSIIFENGKYKFGGQDGIKIKGDEPPPGSYSEYSHTKISSEKLLELNKDMTYEQVQQILGGTPHLGAQQDGVYNYFIDNRYFFHIQCTEETKDKLFLMDGSKLWEKIKKGDYNTLTENKIRAIGADMTNLQVFEYLGYTGANMTTSSDKKYEFEYEIGWRRYTLAFNDPYDKIGVSGTEIWNNILKKSFSWSKFVSR